MCLRAAWRALAVAGVDSELALGTLERVLEHEREIPLLFTTLCTLEVELTQSTASLVLAGIGAGTSLFTGRSILFSASRQVPIGYAAAAVTFVAVHFDGYGDSGVTGDVRCFDSKYYAYEEREPVAHDAAYLQEHFETLVPMGYENDCGGFGDVVLDVAARKITVERNDRFEDYTTSTYEI